MIVKKNIKKKKMEHKRKKKKKIHNYNKENSSDDDEYDEFRYIKMYLKSGIQLDKKKQKNVKLL